MLKVSGMLYAGERTHSLADLFNFYSFARLNLVCMRIHIITLLAYTYIVNITNVLGRGSDSSQRFRKSNM